MSEQKMSDLQVANHWLPLVNRHRQELAKAIRDYRAGRSIHDVAQMVSKSYPEPCESYDQVIEVFDMASNLRREYEEGLLLGAFLWSRNGPRESQ